MWQAFGVRLTMLLVSRKVAWCHGARQLHRRARLEAEQAEGGAAGRAGRADYARQAGVVGERRHHKCVELMVITP